MWPVVEKAIDFVLDLQTPRGEILWARHADGTPWSFALLTGSSSICHSLRCAIAIAELLGHERPDWELSRRPPRPRHPRRARRLRPQAPLGDGLVLPGARRRRARATTGRARLGRAPRHVRRWRAAACAACPTARGSPSAETCECALAHLAVGDRDDGRDAVRLGPAVPRDDDGRYWTGIVFPDEAHFPGGERSTYTAAAVVLAADALAGSTPAAGLFVDDTTASSRR